MAGGMAQRCDLLREREDSEQKSLNDFEEVDHGDDDNDDDGLTVQVDEVGPYLFVGGDIVRAKRLQHPDADGEADVAGFASTAHDGIRLPVLAYVRRSRPPPITIGCTAMITGLVANQQTNNMVHRVSCRN